MKNGDFRRQAAIVKATQAERRAPRSHGGFKRITAPFNGIVTARTTDVGALINAAAAKGSSCFVVSDTHELRLYVNVPQTYAAQITPAYTGADDGPGASGPDVCATVQASAQSVDPPQAPRSYSSRWTTRAESWCRRVRQCAV